MKIKWFLILISLLSVFIPVYGQEGHPSWWWDSKSADFIVEGTINYDPANYYELNPVRIEGKNTKYYWIVGSLKISRVLFVNKNSQHLESYQQYLKNIDKTHPVLLPAYESTIFSSASRPQSLLRPLPGLDIPKGAAVFNLSQIYIFPILDLKVESTVPEENVAEAIGLIEKRPNNYLVK